jgi:hypothetical protein
MPRRTVYKAKNLDAPDTVRSHVVVTTCVLEENAGHDLLAVFNRGGRSGQLVVQKGDGALLADRLMGPGYTREVGPGDPDTF